MKLLRILAVVLIAVALMLPLSFHVLQAAGNTYYVAKTGNDTTGNGSSGNPWLTIQHGVSALSPGDTLYVKAGTYNEAVNVNVSGTSGNYITIEKYASDSVIVTGYKGFLIYNQSYIEVNGFEITGGNTGVYIYGTSHYVILRNLTIHNMAASGITSGTDDGGYHPGDVTHILIDGCNIYGTNTANENEALSIITNDYFEIKNSTVHDTPIWGGGVNQQAGIDCKVGSSNGSIHNNEIYNTGSQLYIDNNGHATSNIDIYDNKIHDSTLGIGIYLGSEKSPQSMTGINIYNNILYGNRRGFMAWGEAGAFTKTFSLINNTFYRNAASGLQEIYIADAYNSQSGCVIRNNIISGLTATSALIQYAGYTSGGVTIDHNLFYDPNGYSSDNQYGTSYVMADPLLVNPPTDFNISSGSPAKDAGVATAAPATDYAGVSRPQGSAYDIGAYEYTSVVNPPIIATTAASSVGGTSAILNGNLSSLGSAASVTLSFEYGFTTSYGNTVNAYTPVVSGTGAFHANLINLSYSTTYHYRAKAVGTSTVYGSDVTFTTSSVVSPTISTSAATAIAGTTVTLNGNLTSLGTASSVAVTFEYGLTTSYGSTWTASESPMAAIGTNHADVTGLQNGTLYHFRAKAIGSGTSYGLDQSFTTTGVPPPPTSSTPPVTAAPEPPFTPPVNTSSAQDLGNSAFPLIFVAVLVLLLFKQTESGSHGLVNLVVIILAVVIGASLLSVLAHALGS